MIKTKIKLSEELVAEFRNLSRATMVILFDENDVTINEDGIKEIHKYTIEVMYLE